MPQKGDAFDSYPGGQPRIWLSSLMSYEKKFLMQNDDSVDPRTVGYGSQEVWVKRESTVTLAATESRKVIAAI